MASREVRRLDSWKEIAEYLGRDVSTVRRWEDEKGLPVHRVPGGRRQAVFTFSDELDQWLLGSELDGSRAAASEGPGAVAPGSQLREADLQLRQWPPQETGAWSEGAAEISLAPRSPRPRRDLSPLHWAADS